MRHWYSKFQKYILCNVCANPSHSQYYLFYNWICFVVFDLFWALNFSMWMWNLIFWNSPERLNGNNTWLSNLFTDIIFISKIWEIVVDFHWRIFGLHRLQNPAMRSLPVDGTAFQKSHVWPHCCFMWVAHCGSSKVLTIRPKSSISASLVNIWAHWQLYFLRVNCAHRLLFKAYKKRIVVWASCTLS